MENRSEQSKFNMAAATLEGLHESMMKSITNYRNGNIKGWFYDLKGMKFQIIAKLKEEEREKLKSIENKVSKYFSITYTNPKAILLAIKEIENYNQALQDVMEDKGLLLVNKEDETIFT